MSNRKQIILGAYLGGVNHHTLWGLPEAGSQIDFSTFEHTAGPPSAASSTSSSSPRGSRCASAAGRSSTRTSSAAPTRSPCSPRWPP